MKGENILSVISRPAVFLDRDGTINKEKNFLYKINDIEFYDGVEDAIADLKREGYLVFVVTNQSGIARGFFTERDVLVLHEYINRRLLDHGGKVDHFFYCPHHPEGTVKKYRIVCDCRKPNHGMLKQALNQFPVDWSRSWMVGDRKSDIECGMTAGLSTILVESGYGLDTKGDYFRVPTLKEAVAHILRKG